MTEIAKRLAPKGDVLRELYLKSGNECAFPGCHRIMIDSEGIFVGQICHIEAAEEGGERFNKLQANEDRRAFSNLMLLCYDHHQVTNDTAKYTVERLQEMKGFHELKFGSVIKKMRETISDHTEASELSPAKKLARFNITNVWEMENDENMAVLNEFAGRIRQLPIPTRQLLSVAIKRAIPVREYLGGRMGRLGISVSELGIACDIKMDDLRPHLHMIEHQGIITEDYPEDYNGLEAINFKKVDDWDIVDDLRSFSENTAVALEELIVNLRFDLLDA